MRLISLNTWGGRLGTALLAFISEQANQTDIFCFQEVYNNAPQDLAASINRNLYQSIVNILPTHKGHYAPIQDNDEGLAMFVRHGITCASVDSVFVHRHRNALSNNDRRTLGRNIQYATFVNGKKQYTVINFHGLWTGAGKSDTPDRLKQSHKIRDFMDSQSSEKIILVGDFNLNPETDSMVILEKGMRNLIAEYGITSTRSQHHTWTSKLADYVIVSKELSVQQFEVLQNQVSDHLPLLLNFS